ncbi:MAG: hypothetical protein LBM62_05905, partial [Mediterranea sp.]|nr:hypothetical protein [Mediterranea sp.]
RLFALLVDQLLKEGKTEKARAALDYTEKMIPEFNVPYDMQNGALQLAAAYYRLGDTAKGDHIMSALLDKAVEYITWYLSLDDRRRADGMYQVSYQMMLMDRCIEQLKTYNSEKAALYEGKYEELYHIIISERAQ